MKRIALWMMLWCLLQAGAAAGAEEECPKQEIRAVWLTTIYGLDWPTRTATDWDGRDRQKQEVRHILDRLLEANFNTVFVQARLRGDVIYPSKIEPLSAVFAGSYGLWPGYDPLAFVIEECHKRGMECHAFFVTFPVGTERMVREQGMSSVVRRHPELCLRHQGSWYLDPGQPGTADYLLSLVDEVVRNYDLDGIQFDYIRYPDNAATFPDSASYRRYGRGRRRGDWRRENINHLMARIHDRVKQLKPWVQVSSSPLGKYSKSGRTPHAKWTAYEDVFQDPKAWLQAGKQDMIVPMMYYRRNDFYPFVSTWLEQSGQRNMVAGLGAYRLNRHEGDWSLSEISDQITYVRKQGVKGCAFFRAGFVIGNEKGLYNELKNRFFKYPAQLPPLTWMSAATAAPCEPREVQVTRERGGLRLRWQGEPGCLYTLYYAPADSIDLGRAHSILATGIRACEWFLPVNADDEREYSFCVTASNRYRIESRPSRTTYYYFSRYEK